MLPSNPLGRPFIQYPSCGGLGRIRALFRSGVELFYLRQDAFSAIFSHPEVDLLSSTDPPQSALL